MQSTRRARGPAHNLKTPCCSGLISPPMFAAHRAGGRRPQSSNADQEEGASPEGDRPLLFLLTAVRNRESARLGLARGARVPAISGSVEGPRSFVRSSRSRPACFLRTHWEPENNPHTSHRFSTNYGNTLPPPAGAVKLEDRCSSLQSKRAGTCRPGNARKPALSRPCCSW